MSNMSYCRFENTARDVEDCLEAIDNGAIHDMSTQEAEALRSLLEYAKHIVELEDEINEAVDKTI